MNNDLTVVEVAQQLLIDAELLDPSPVCHAETIKAVAKLIQQPAPDLIAGHRRCRLLPFPHPFGCARGDGQRVAAEQHDGRRAGLPARLGGLRAAWRSSADRHRAHIQRCAGTGEGGKADDRR